MMRLAVWHAAGVLVALVIPTGIASRDAEPIRPQAVGAPYTCGPDAMYLVLRVLGKRPSLRELRKAAKAGEGVSLTELHDMADRWGVKTTMLQVSGRIPRELLPCIAHVRKNHFVALLAAGDESPGDWLAFDNARGLWRMSPSAFSKRYGQVEFILSFHPPSRIRSLTKQRQLQRAVGLCGLGIVMAVGLYLVGRVKKRGSR